ncbi:hypothetical protein MMC31_001378 [Peltigera leucophlebia]|nr:hypothetical protein [Peltigera leucophlebia]
MPFSEDDINTAYQLHELLHESGSRYVGEIGTESAELVVFVVGQNPNPARITRSQAPSQPFHTLSIDYDAERRQVLCTWWTSTQAQLRHPDFLVWKKRNPNALSVFKLGPGETRCRKRSTNTEGSTFSLVDVKDNFGKDSSPISIQPRQASTEEIERSQQNPAKATRNTETAALIVEAVRPVLQEEPNKLPQGGPAGPPGPLGRVVSGHIVADLKWNATELGFFDPNYDNKSSQTASDTTPSAYGGRYAGCLLSPDIKSLIRYGTCIDEWEKQLLKRFRLAPHIAMMMMVNERYTVEDAHRHREPGDFAGNIMQAAKDAELTSPITPTPNHHLIKKRDLETQLPALEKVEIFLESIKALSLLINYIELIQPGEGVVSGNAPPGPKEKKIHPKLVKSIIKIYDFEQCLPFPTSESSLHLEQIFGIDRVPWPDTHSKLDIIHLKASKELKSLLRSYGFVSFFFTSRNQKARLFISQQPGVPAPRLPRWLRIPFLVMAPGSRETITLETINPIIQRGDKLAEQDKADIGVYTDDCGFLKILRAHLQQFEVITDSEDSGGIQYLVHVLEE